MAGMKDSKSNQGSMGAGTLQQRWDVALAAACEIEALAVALRSTMDENQNEWIVQRLLLDRITAMAQATIAVSDDEDIREIASRLTWPHHVDGIEPARAL